MKRLGLKLLMGGLAASIATVPGAARSTPEMQAVSPQGRWADVPHLPLRPPAPAMDARQDWGARGWAASPQMHRHGGWDAPWGGTRHRFSRGFFLPSYWAGPRFIVTNWSGYGLAAPGYGRNWVRYYDDAYLIDRSGRIYDMVYDIDWERYDHGPVPEYVGAAEEEAWEAPVAPGPCCVPPGAHVYHAQPGTTTIIIQSVPVVTTKTIVTEEVVYRPARPKLVKMGQPRLKYSKYRK